MPENDFDLLIEASNLAAEIALRHFRSDPKSWEKEGGEGLVTEADLEVDDFLKGFLTSARPDYGWLSEETTDTPERSEKSRVFIVDPIDGTRSFASGNQTWAHSLAIVEDGKPVAGVVHLPARDKLYSADRTAAWLNETSIRPSARSAIEGADVLGPRSLTDPGNWHEPAPDFARHFRPSLAYRLALVAEGRFDAMITLRPAWEWDVAAGVLIAQAAGGQVTDQAGNDLAFNAPHPKVAGVVATGKNLHPEVARRLKSP